MSINNKFNLGDRVRIKTTPTSIPWMQGEIVSIDAKVSSDFNRRSVEYRIRPDNGKGAGFHCTYPEDQWEALTESKDAKS